MRATALKRAGPLAPSLAASASIQGVSVLTGVLLARSLGPQGRGELAAVLLWPALLAGVGDLGIAEATTYHAARATSTLGTLVGTTLALSVVQSALLVAIGAAIVPLVLSHYDGEVVQTAYVFLAYIPLSFLMLYPLTILQGLQRFRTFNALRVLAVAAPAVGLTALALAHRLRVETAALSYLVAYLATGAISAALLARAGAMQLGVDLGLTRKLLGYGLRSHTSNVSALLNVRLDQLLISVFLAPARLGLYVIAVTLTSVTAIVGSTASLVAFPTVARLETTHERRLAAARYARVTLALSLALTAPALLLAPALIRLFFGAAYEGAASVSRVLLVAAVVLSTNRTLGAVVRAVNRPLDAGVAELIALGATVAGLAVLLPALGIMGAAITSLLAYLVSTAWLASKTARVLNLGVAGLFLPIRLEPVQERCAALPEGSSAPLSKVRGQ